MSSGDFYVDSDVLNLISDLLDQVCFAKPSSADSQKKPNVQTQQAVKRKWNEQAPINSGKCRDTSSEASWTEPPAGSDLDSNVPDSVGGALCIFYTESPFSDFHPSQFIWDGKFYNSMEHFFQIQMIFSFGMFRLAQKIREIPDAAIFRRTLRMNLRTMVKSGLFDEKMFAEWRKTNAFKMMRIGNKAKFEQNFTLKEQLLATGERLLIFTAKNDSLLGVGMTEAGFLHWLRVNRFCLEDLLDFFTGVRPRPKGLGRNYLGLALMEVRSELSGSPSVLYEWRQQRPNLCPDDWAGSIEPSGEKVIEFYEGPQASAQNVAQTPQPDLSGAEHENTPVEESVVSRSQDITDSAGSESAMDAESTEDSTPNVLENSNAANSSEDGAAPPVDNQYEPAQLPTYSLEGCPTDAAVSRFQEQQRSQFKQSDVTTALERARKIAAKTCETIASKPKPSKKKKKKADKQTKVDNPPKVDTPTKVATVAAREVIILPGEKRIVYQRKDAQPKVIGDLAEQSIPGQSESEISKKKNRQSRWEKKEAAMGQNFPAISAGPNSKEKNLSVLERLRNLKLDKPMINPFSLGNDKYDSFLKPAKTKEILLNTYNEDGSEIAVVDEDEVPMYWELEQRPEEPSYHAEPGEIPPDETILPKYAYMLPKVVGRPAGLPYHLLRNLPPAPPPPGMEEFGPAHFQYPTGKLKKDGRPRRGPEAPPMWYPSFVPAPPQEKKDKRWQPPKDPALQIKIKARKLIEAAKQRLEREQIEQKIREEEEAEARAAREAAVKRRRRYWDMEEKDSDFEEEDDDDDDDGEEGGTPMMYYGKKKKASENDIPPIKKEIKEELEDEVKKPTVNLALDKKLFPFGMEATLDDLLAMGFVPPPIFTDPQCRSRNLGRSKDHWQFYFENPEAAFRHAANRWVKAGRLTTTGKYEDAADNEDEEEIDFNYESSDDEEAEAEFQKRRKRFDTKIIYVDTFQYDEYVRYYQQNHGCTPLPTEITGESLDVDGLRNWYHYYKASVNPKVEADVLGTDREFGGGNSEEVFSNLSDYYAVTTWRRRQEEEERESVVDTRLIPQEQWGDGVEYEAKPVKYEYDPKELEEWKKYEDSQRVNFEGSVAVKQEIEIDEEATTVNTEPEFVDLEKEFEAIINQNSTSSQSETIEM